MKENRVFQLLGYRLIRRFSSSRDIFVTTHWMRKDGSHIFLHPQQLPGLSNMKHLKQLHSGLIPWDLIHRFNHIMFQEIMKDVIRRRFHSLLWMGLVSHLVLSRGNHTSQSLLKLTTLKVLMTTSGVVIILHGPKSWRCSSKSFSYFILALPVIVICNCCFTAITFRPITRKCLEITLFASTKERSLMLRWVAMMFLF